MYKFTAFNRIVCLKLKFLNIFIYLRVIHFKFLLRMFCLYVLVF